MRGKQHKEESCKRDLLRKGNGGGRGADGQTDSKSTKVTTYYFWRLRDPKLNTYNGHLTSIYT